MTTGTAQGTIRGTFSEAAKAFREGEEVRRDQAERRKRQREYSAEMELRRNARKAQKVRKEAEAALAHRPTALLVEKVLTVGQDKDALARLLFPYAVDREAAKATEARRKLAAESRKRKSKQAGVTFHRRDKVWQARASIGGQQRYLGSFQTAKEATEAVLAAKG